MSPSKHPFLISLKNHFLLFLSPSICLTSNGSCKQKTVEIILTQFDTFSRAGWCKLYLVHFLKIEQYLIGQFPALPSVFH